MCTVYVSNGPPVVLHNDMIMSISHKSNILPKLSSTDEYHLV